jgi:hypothetical protein
MSADPQYTPFLSRDNVRLKVEALERQDSVI